MKSDSPVNRKEDKTIVRFLKQAKDGKFMEINPENLEHRRMPDYLQVDYQEEVYHYFYS
ncbi:hypothetical protein ACFL9T_23365 [Thermodesulfobacteriota bacterium]